MKTVRVTMSDEAYASLSAEAKGEGLPGVASLLLKKSGELTDDAEAADIKKKALNSALRKEPGSEFRLRDLFSKDKWEGFSKGARIRAGRQFFEEVSSKNTDVKALSKSSSNHQYYVRVV